MSPSVSCVKQGREWERDNPLCLAFRAREGGGDGRLMSPSVSRFERGREWGVGEGGSRGGGGRQMSPSVSRFERGRDRQPPPSHISSERGGGANTK